MQRGGGTQAACRCGKPSIGTCAECGRPVCADHGEQQDGRLVCREHRAAHEHAELHQQARLARQLGATIPTLVAEFLRVMAAAGNPGRTRLPRRGWLGRRRSGWEVAAQETYSRSTGRLKQTDRLVLLPDGTFRRVVCPADRPLAKGKLQRGEEPVPVHVPPSQIFAQVPGRLDDLLAVNHLQWPRPD